MRLPTTLICLSAIRRSTCAVTCALMPSLMRRAALISSGWMPHFAGLVDQVIRIDADAMAADQAGAKIEKIPLCPGGLEHFLGVDAQTREDQRQLVDQRDVHVALRVLDRLGRLGDADARRTIGAGANDAPIQRVDEIGDFRRRARRDLDDVGQPARLVAGIDALGAVAAKEIVDSSSGPKRVRSAGTQTSSVAPGIHGRLVDDQRAAATSRGRPFRWPRISRLRSGHLCGVTGVGTAMMYTLHRAVDAGSAL